MTSQNYKKFYTMNNTYKKNLLGGSGVLDNIHSLSESDIYKLKLSELKAYLESLNLNSKGREKKKLADRLIEYLRANKDEDVYECENNCGFKGTFLEVEKHELTCKYIDTSESLSSDMSSESDIASTLSISSLDSNVTEFKDTIQDKILFQDPLVNNRTDLINYTSSTMSAFPKFINDNSADKRNIENNKLGTTGLQPGLKIKNWDEINQTYYNIEPFRHQKFVMDYLNFNTPYRGLLLYHGLGSGKTGAAIMTAQGYPYKKTAILLPASLRNNFRDEIKKYGEISYKKDFFWIFVPINLENFKKNEKAYIDILEEKGIHKELFKLIIDKFPKSTNPGIWVIDSNEDSPNYNNLSESQQSVLDRQINLMINYKYQFIHYNAGSYSVIGDTIHGNSAMNLLDNYHEWYNAFIGDKSISELTSNDHNNIIDKLYEDDMNPFNDKVIIIDEVHNFTAGILGSIHKSRLYEMILRSKNSNLIFLSGTPVINKPYELALLFNMLKGLFTTFELKISKSSGSFDIKSLTNTLNNYKYIERFEIDQNASTILISKVPNGFVKNILGDEINFTKESTLSTNNFLRDIKILLEKIGYSVISTIKKESTIFPDILSENSTIVGSRIVSKKEGSDYKQLKEQEFNDYYIDTNMIKEDEALVSNTIIKNSNAFKNRILGTISFYNEISSMDKKEIIFPEKIYASAEKTNIVMTDYQFILYCKARAIEKKLEDQIKKTRLSNQNSKNLLSEPSSLFRVYTRQKGLFVFPPNIDRPTLSEINLIDRLEKGIKQMILSGSVDKYIKKLIELDDKSETHYQELSVYIDTVLKEIASVDRKISEALKNSFLIIFNLIYDVDFTYNFNVDFMESISEIKDKISNKQISKKNNILYDDIITTIKDFNYSDFLSKDLGSYSELCQKAIDDLTQDNLTINDSLFDLRVLSPKYVKVLENVYQTPGPVVIYSQYRQVEGIETLSKTLDFNGYSKIDSSKDPIIADNNIKVGDMVRYTDKKSLKSQTYKVVSIKDQNQYTIKNDNNTYVKLKSEISKCRYALWTGTESKEERDAILHLFNNNNNNFGDSCLILLITQSGAEGINLFCVRQVHILEPYWNNVRVNQVIGRARRVHSHRTLPSDQRNVEIFNYIIQFSEAQLSGDWIDLIQDEIIFKIKIYENNKDAFRIDNSDATSFINADKQGKTSDQVLEIISKDKEILLNEFLNLMKEVSIDCSFNKEANINSDHNLASIKCYDNPSDRIDNKYVLDIDVLNIKSKKQDIFTKKIKKKRETIPFQFIFNSEKIMLYVFTILSHDVNSWIDMRVDTNLYDWYRYNGLDPDHRNEFDKLEKIGIFKIIDKKQQFVLNNEFKNKITQYIDIHKCYEQILSKESSSNLTMFEKDRVQQVRFNNRVFDCYDGKKSIWICPGCDSEYDSSVLECIDCEITKDEVDETNYNEPPIQEELTKSSSSLKSSDQNIKLVIDNLDESITQEANLGDTESGDSETSPVTESVDTSSTS